MLNLGHNAIYLFHALVVGPVLIWLGKTCGDCKCKCIPNWVSVTLIISGIVVILYHLWSFIKVAKMREMFMMRENFVHEGGSLGLPLWGLPARIEGYTDFSFPYQRNDHCFYSYHDQEHKRKCPCDPVTGVCTCQPNGNCTRAGPSSKPAGPVPTGTDLEGFTGSMDNAGMHAGVADGTYLYGMKPKVPVMGRNPIA